MRDRVVQPICVLLHFFFLFLKWSRHLFFFLLFASPGLEIDSTAGITRYDICSSVYHILHNALWHTSSTGSHFHSECVLRLNCVIFYDSCQFYMSLNGGPRGGSTVWNWYLGEFCLINHKREREKKKTSIPGYHYLYSVCMYCDCSVHIHVQVCPYGSEN